MKLAENDMVHYQAIKKVTSILNPSEFQVLGLLIPRDDFKPFDLFVRHINKNLEYTNDIFGVSVHGTKNPKTTSFMIDSDKLSFLRNERIPVVLSLYNLVTDKFYITTAQISERPDGEKGDSRRISFNDNDLFTGSKQLMNLIKDSYNRI